MKKCTICGRELSDLEIGECTQCAHTTNFYRNVVKGFKGLVLFVVYIIFGGPRFMRKNV